MSLSPFTSESSTLSFDQFCEAWREGSRARLSPDADSAEILVCALQGLLDPFLDGISESDFHVIDVQAADGLHAVYLTEEESAESDAVPTAYLLRAVMSSDLRAEGTVALSETGKILRRLDAGREHSSEVWDVLFDWLEVNGRNMRIKLVFASLHPMPEREVEVLPGAADMVAARFGIDCEALNLSLDTLFRGNAGVQIALPVATGEQSLSPDFVAGTVSLMDLWKFLGEYKSLRGELDRLYDKNVRLFQGKGKKANKAIVKTLREEPHLFGMLNNGLTFVARTVERQGNAFLLRDPSVVNGCQTTRTVFDTLTEEFKKSTASPQDYVVWKEKLQSAQVVVKIVRVAPGEDDAQAGLLEKITRSTNLQTAVKEKDFIALDEDFRRWKREMAGYGVFLEILSNETTLQLARQKRRDYQGARFVHFAKAFELFKIYGAGWMNEPGPAWNKNAAFLPGGNVFKEIVAQDAFGGPDLLAAFYLQQASTLHKFGGRGKIAEGPNKERLERRRLTRFVFYRTTLELLRRVLASHQLPTDRAALTRALLALHEQTDEWDKFVRESVDVIDEYMNTQHENALTGEPSYAGDFNAFFKREDLHKSSEKYPRIWAEWSVRAAILRRASPRLGEILSTAFEK